MNFQFTERCRVLVSGLVMTTVAALLTLTVALALSPENLLRNAVRENADARAVEV